MNNCRPFDILIIGAGPAGISAALESSRSGIPPSIGLIDRKKTPGAPVRCGEAIGLKGFAPYIQIDKKWVMNTIRKAKLVSPSGIVVTLPGDNENFIIDREKMERDLIERAIRRGVAFIPGTTILSISRSKDGHYACCGSSGELFEAKCIILAEGVESRLARTLGWNTTLSPSDIISCAFARMTYESLEPDVCHFFVGRSVAPGGYAWVFPRGAHEANIGLGIQGVISRPGLAKELLLRFIEHRFPSATTSQMHCGGVPVAPWLRPAVKDGVMIIGDAARQVNCISGAGIAYSMIAGNAAGAAAAGAFRRDQSDFFDLKVLKQYEKQWASHYGKQQKRSFSLKNTIVEFSDAFLDDLARSLEKNDSNSLGVAAIFLKAFSKHPFQLPKVLKLFG
jgi:digeranylgeranylglycerophospholipid reductase